MKNDNNKMEFKTIAYLKENTPFSKIFPDGIVPIISIFPIIPREIGSPECYVVQPAALSAKQIEDLAVKLLEYWPTECLTLDEAIAYIRKGLPLRTDWFNSCSTSDPWFNSWSTSDPGIFFSMMPDLDFEEEDADIARGWDEDWEESKN